MKKVCVDESTCIACGACIQIDAEHFDWSDAGTSKAINETSNLESAALTSAIDSCPVGAISVKEESSENCGNCENCHCNEQ